MFLLIGLGNPGGKYAGTRHNAGFIVLDYLAAKNKLVFVRQWQAERCETLLWRIPLLLFKPQTYMNLSGEAVRQAVRHYQLPPARLIVVHDDLDLPLGRVKIVGQGGDGGHKGVRSIIDCLGTRAFPRIRIGIASPRLRAAPPIPVEEYVLEDFDHEEQRVLEGLLPLIAEGLRLIVAEGVEAAMNKINRR